MEEEAKAQIGTYREKSIHAGLKKLLDPDESHYEVKLGRYIADLFDGRRVTEIQTRSFYKMKSKLDAFLADTDRIPDGVRLIFPATGEKHVYWVGESGEITGGRKSPKHWGKQDVFRELYAIRGYLSHPRLSVEMIVVNYDEFRRLDGWSRDKKSGSTKIDRVPTSFGERIVLSSEEDYASLIPASLPEFFTISDYAKASHLKQNAAGQALIVLRSVGAVTVMPDTGRKLLYRRTFSATLDKKTKNG